MSNSLNCEIPTKNCPLHDYFKKNCDFCAGTKTFYQNSLAATNPPLSIYWHPFLNGELTPYEVTATSKQIVWWQCPTCKTSWKASATNMHRENLSEPCCSVTHL